MKTHQFWTYGWGLMVIGTAMITIGFLFQNRLYGLVLLTIFGFFVTLGALTWIVKGFDKEVSP